MILETQWISRDPLRNKYDIPILVSSKAPVV